MDKPLPFAAYVLLAARIPVTPRPRECPAPMSEQERAERRAERRARAGGVSRAEYMRRWRAGKIASRDGSV